MPDWLSNLFGGWGGGSDYYSPPDTYDSYNFYGDSMPSAFVPDVPVSYTPSVDTSTPVVVAPSVDSYYSAPQDMGVSSSYEAPVIALPTSSYVEPMTQTDYTQSLSYGMDPIFGSSSSDTGAGGYEFVGGYPAAPAIASAVETPPHYTELRPVIDAGSTPPVLAAEAPSLLDRVSKAGEGLDNFLKKNSTLVSLGAGGLQAYMAAQQQKKAAERRAAQEAEVKGRLAQREARTARYNAPIDYSAYRTNRTQLQPGVSDYRQTVDPRTRLHFTRSPRISEAITRESNRAASGGLVQLARGGSTSKKPSRAVMGPTGGQDDKIPALLSDGEFVIDADTVSALGDGNNAAGAAKLDQLRQNVREHKRSAPKTSIPPKAKPIQKYMGGKT